MPFYDYICLDCVSSLVPDDREPTTEEANECVFETRHSMFAKDDELERTTSCPKCGGKNTKKLIRAENISTLVRGVVWEEYLRNNRKAISRDMALHQLQEDDPYAGMREDGESDHLANVLKKGGLHKTKPIIFT